MLNFGSVRLVGIVSSLVIVLSVILQFTDGLPVVSLEKRFLRDIINGETVQTALKDHGSKILTDLLTTKGSNKDLADAKGDSPADEEEDGAAVDEDPVDAEGDPPADEEEDGAAVDEDPVDAEGDPPADEEEDEAAGDEDEVPAKKVEADANEEEEAVADDEPVPDEEGEAAAEEPADEGDEAPLDNEPAAE